MTWRLLPAALRAATFLILWLVLTDGSARSPLVAALSVAAATGASLWLWPPERRRVRWGAVPRLAGFFAIHALLGGLDVARRAVTPGLPLDPARIDYESGLTDEFALVLFVWMIGLMPGTACVGLSGATCSVHVIDRHAYGARDLARLERRIAAVFPSAALRGGVRPQLGPQSPTD